MRQKRRHGAASADGVEGGICKTLLADPSDRFILATAEVRALVSSAAVVDAARQFEQAGGEAREEEARRDAEAEAASQEWADRQAAMREAAQRPDQEPSFSSVFDQEPRSARPVPRRPRSGGDDDEDFSDRSCLY